MPSSALDITTLWKTLELAHLSGNIERMGADKANTVIDKNNATLLGYTRLKRPVYFPDDARHLLIIGTTGAGKTISVSNPIKHAIKQSKGLLLIDGKGDMDENSMLEITKRFCAEEGRKLHIINMNNPSQSDKYNPLRGATETVAKDMLVNMSDWSEEHYKANAERYIQRVVKMLRLAEIKLSFHTVVSNMSTDKFEMLSSSLVKDSVISKEQHISNLELIKSSGKIAEQAAARFATIAESEIGQIFDEDGIDIYTALEAGEVIIFVLSPLLFPETTKAFGRLALIDAKKAVSKLFGKGKSITICCDEINTYATPVLTDLVNKSRSAGATVILATQSFADLDAAAGEAFRRQVVENCNHCLFMRQNEPKDAEITAQIIGTKDKMQMTYQMSQSEATGMGTAKRVREFIAHPDDVKNLQQSEAFYLSRDNGKCERIKVIKPF